MKLHEQLARKRGLDSQVSTILKELTIAGGRLELQIQAISSEAKNPDIGMRISESVTTSKMGVQISPGSPIKLMTL